jgi:hypothetical protein
MWKKIGIGVAALLVAVLAFLTWYKFHYSMDVAQSYEINAPALEQRVLIATQGSAFKDAVVSALIAHLKERNVYVKVIDVSALPGVDEGKWSAIVVIHTWENWKPQADAKTFLERAKDLKKVIVVTTSGRGDFKMEGVNAITSASVMANAPAIAAKIESRLAPLLETGGQ